MSAEPERLKQVAYDWFKRGANIVLVDGKKAVHNWNEWQEKRQSEQDFNALPWNERGWNGIAIVCGSPFGVVDIDVKHNTPEIIERQAKFKESLRLATYMEKTPSGGLHLIYRVRRTVESVSSTSPAAKWSQIEVLGKERLCVLAPSPGYTPCGSDIIAEIESLNEPYFSTLNRIGYKATAKKEFVNVAELLKGVKEGERDNAAIRLAAYYRKKGLDHKQTLQKLLEWDASNQPPLGTVVLAQKVESAFKSDTPYNFSFIEPKGEGKQPKITYKLSGVCELGPYEAVIQGDKLGFLILKDNGEFEFAETMLNEGKPVTPRERVPEPGHYGVYEKPVPALAEIFSMVRSEFDTFLDCDEKYKDLLSACVLLTYQIEKVNTTPYVYVYGDNESGKTVCLQLQQWLCYRPLYTISPTASDIYGYLGQSDVTGAILEDEAQDFWKDTDKVKVYKSGYKNGACVSRWWDTPNGTKELVFFPTFDYKAVASEKLPNVKGLIERFIFMPMSEGIPKRDWVDINDDDKRRLCELRDLLLKWRISTRLAGPLPTLEIGTRGRLKELWKPLLRVTYGLPVEQRLRAFLNEQVSERMKDKQSTIEARIVKVVLDVWEEKKPCYNCDLWNKLREELKGEISDAKKPNQMQTAEFGKVTTVFLGYRIRELFGVKSEVFKAEDGSCERGYMVPVRRLIKLAKKYGYDIPEKVTRLQGLQLLGEPQASESLESMGKHHENNDKTTEKPPFGASTTCNTRNLVTIIHLEPIERGKCALCDKFENLVYQVQYTTGEWANACLSCGEPLYEKFNREREGA